MKNIVTIISILLLSNILLSQTTGSLYIPLEIQKAYKNQTRSKDGKPGINYYQNRTDYKIRAEFFPNTNMLTGNEIITYVNNSPDSLSYIYINLYQNIFKKGEARDSNFSPRNIHDGVEISEIKINNSLIDLEKTISTSTLLIIHLPSKIAPSSQSIIEVSWSQKLPVSPLYRIGTYNETNFFIGYWYPKINVYDDIVGWNTFGFTGNAEFYSDYGNFDVEITVPSEYLVWSSGELLNAADILEDSYLEKIRKASLVDEVVNIVKEKDWEDNHITKIAEKHTWKLKANNLTDFAFAISNSYLWDATSIEVGNKRVTVNSVYNRNSPFFRDVVDISRKSIDYLSNTAPKIPYPYPQLTVFNCGKNGMEFPGMVNDQEENSELGTIFITTHEIAHAYLPFMVGINEQKYGWMDEGFVGFLSIIMLSDFIEDKEYSFFKEVVKKYNQQAGKLGIDLPLLIGSHNAGDFTYGFNTYVRPITAFYLLYEYLEKKGIIKVFRNL